MMSLRERLFPYTWPLTFPVRLYVKYAPLQRGKGFLSRLLLRPLLPPPPSSFLATLPGGGEIALQYRELIGFSTLVRGTFEGSEIAFLSERATAGSTAIDVGANVGLFTVPLARAVGAEGCILAFEPVAATAQRLRENVAQNRLANVEIYELAAGERSGRAWVRLAGDAAFHAITADRRGAAPAAEVPVVTLDSVWHQRKRPHVSVLKVDVEGNELAVLRGASALLAASKPVVLAEAATDDAVSVLGGFLGAYGYERRQPARFRPWNHVFLPGSQRTRAMP